MPGFPTELQRGVFSYLLYVAGGLLMTVTVGSGQCVDVAVRTVQNPAHLLRLSTTLMGLLGCQHVANSKTKGKLKRLYFTESLNSLLDMTSATLQGLLDIKGIRLLSGSPERQIHHESTPDNCVSTKRCRIYYVLLSGMSSQIIVTLCMGDKGNKLKTYSPSNPLQWLANFGSRAKARGDVVLLFVGGQTGKNNNASAISLPQTLPDPTSTTEQRPEILALGLSVLSVLLFWTFLPYIAVYSAICLGRKMQRCLT